MKWLLTSLSVLFSLLIIYEIYSVIFFQQQIQASAEKSLNLPVAAHESTEGQTIRYDFFGEYIPSDMRASNIKKSMLNVKLVGIFYAANLDESEVLIESAGGDVRVYRLNHKIPGGAVLKSIMFDAVLVEREGELERLSLPKQELMFEPVAKPLLED